MTNETEKPWKKLINMLTEEQIISIITNLGSAPPKRDSSNNLVFQSICHHSDSYKLCYYTETHNFFCYKEWKEFTLFSLIMVVLNVEFAEAFKYVTDYFNIDSFQLREKPSFFNNFAKKDWDILDKYDTSSSCTNIEEEKVYNPNILNMYSDLYYKGWIDEHISIKAMQKFGIKYDISEDRIIIPHYDVKSNLVGIRCRNLSDTAFAKYCPVQIQNEWYAHSLGNHFYGLAQNCKTIKKLKKVMIVESEKSVLQCENYFPDHNFSVACCGSNISNKQIELLLELGVSEVILGFDFDYETVDSQEFRDYKRNILYKAKKLLPYFEVEILIDCNEKRLLGYKDSPTDKGEEILLNLMNNKIKITDEFLADELNND